MILVERHIINKKDKKYRLIDEAAYKSKNLYNATLYAVRQHYFETNEYISYARLQHIFQTEKQVDYYALPTKVAQWTMKLVDQNFKSFFKSIKQFKENPSKFKGKPKIPYYLDSVNGRYQLTYTKQAISKKELDNKGVIKPSGLEIEIPTRLTYNGIQQVRIVRGVNYYVVEVLYKVEDVLPLDDNGKYAAIDLGINNFATLTTNLEHDIPLVISGKEIKSYNHWYNKELSNRKSILEKRNGTKTSKYINQITIKRNNKISDFMHKSSRYIVNQLVSKGITTLVIGKNKNWKQDTHMGKANNQNFAQIPYNSFIDKLIYKCYLCGISVKLIDESYTSKCSFLDMESICKHDNYLGKRVKRGLFVSSDGTKINADVNGSYNILRKCKPNAFNANGVKGVVVHPLIIKIRN